jgi:class 3 adenylate cyclase/tetratricopeptide (TPR) repeat protein
LARISALCARFCDYLSTRHAKTDATAANRSLVRYGAELDSSISAPYALAVNGEVRKTVTIVFTDIVGSTHLGERLDPEAVRDVMSRYFEAMQLAIEHHGGLVEKFIGDAVMAVYGLPTLHEDDALRAVRAAVEMRIALAELNEELERDHGLRIEARTGVNTGEVIADDPSRGQTLATGDAVNVAARLEQTAEAGEILIGASTYGVVKDAVNVESLEPLALAGKSDMAAAWRLVSLRDDVERQPAAAPFVGREQELATLRSIFDGVVAERICAVATIVGPPGIGKSRLARELIAALARDATVALGRCLAYGESITYAPLLEIARQLEANGRQLSERLAPDDDGAAIAARLAIALGTSDERASPEEIAWAFRRVFEAVGREQPLLVVVDDIHWAEPTLLDLLEYVASFATDVPMLLLCLARADLFEVRPSWAAPRANATVISLEPLNDEETQGLIVGLEARREMSNATRDKIVAAAEGNPLFVEQIVALQADAPGEEVAVPPTIQALLAARIDRLEPGERDILIRAAVEGRLFHRGAVAELLPDATRPQLGADLLSLVRKEFLRPDRALFADDDGFRFSHVLIRDAAYASIPKRLRGELHERYARWLEERIAERVDDYLEILGFHLEQASRYRTELGKSDDALTREAGERLWEAARAAVARMDVPAAVALYDRANALLPDEASGALLQEFGAALNRTDDARVRLVVEQAIERTRQARNRRGELLARLDMFWIPPPDDAQRQNAQIGQDVEALIPELEHLKDSLGLTKAWQLVAMAHHATGRHKQAQSDLEQALLHARRLGDRLEESEVYVTLLETYYHGEVTVDEAIRRCEHEARGRPGNWMVEASALANCGGLYAMRGEFDRGRRLIERSMAVCDEFNLLNVYPTFRRHDLEMLAGDFAAAETGLRADLRNVDHLQHWWSFGFAVQASLAVALGEQERYEEAASMTNVMPAKVGDYMAAHVLWRRGRARALARLGQPDQAATLAHEAVVLAERTDNLNLRGDAFLDRADVLCTCGDEAGAARDVDAALALYERKGNLAMADRARRLSRSSVSPPVLD